MTPGSGLDDAGEDIYYFTVPDKRIRVDVGDGGSFIIKTHAYNRGPTFVGETIILCNDSNNFCREQGYKYWDLPSRAGGNGDYSVRFLVYGWDAMIGQPVLP